MTQLGNITTAIAEAKSGLAKSTGLDAATLAINEKAQLLKDLSDALQELSEKNTHGFFYIQTHSGFDFRGDRVPSKVIFRTDNLQDFVANLSDKGNVTHEPLTPFYSDLTEFSLGGHGEYRIGDLKSKILNSIKYDPATEPDYMHQHAAEKKAFYDKKSEPLEKARDILDENPEIIELIENLFEAKKRYGIATIGLDKAQAEIEKASEQLPADIASEEHEAWLDRIRNSYPQISSRHCN